MSENTRDRGVIKYDDNVETLSVVRRLRVQNAISTRPRVMVRMTTTTYDSNNGNGSNTNNTRAYVWPRGGLRVRRWTFFRPSSASPIHCGSRGDDKHAAAKTFDGQRRLPERAVSGHSP